MEPEFDLAPTRLVIRAAVTGSACILAHVRWRGRERPVPDTQPSFGGSSRRAPSSIRQGHADGVRVGVRDGHHWADEGRRPVAPQQTKAGAPSPVGRRRQAPRRS